MSIRIPTGLAEWVARESRLANSALAEAVRDSGDADLAQALAWSQAVNETIGRMAHGVPPFPLVRESLERLSQAADLVVVSATPGEALEREWREHDLARFVAAICGQEIGTKQELLASAAHYPAGHALMIGDAPGDYRAAQANGAHFWPISPGAEEASWRLLYDEGIERFLSGRLAGDYQARLVDEFFARLPEQAALAQSAARGLIRPVQSLRPRSKAV